MKKLLMLAGAFFFAQAVGAQVSDSVTTEAVSDISTTGVDAALNMAADRACKCVAKIKVKNKSQEEISEKISKCIEEEVSSYSMMSQLMGTLSTGKKSDTIYVSPSGKKHDKYYFEIEREMRDSCYAIKYLAAADNKESDVSMSKNKTALKYYKKGTEAMTAEKYEDAADYFSLAVKEDRVFSFAWDNLAISLRQSGRYLQAIQAYNESLALDPKGVTPLQNLPVVYTLLKNYDKALLSYKNLISLYPQNPEGYFGAAQTLITGNSDYVQALDYVCKSYNLYIKTGSPYRTDAETLINIIYAELKKQGKEDIFNQTLIANHINAGGK